MLRKRGNEDKFLLALLLRTFEVFLVVSRRIEMLVQLVETIEGLGTCGTGVGGSVPRRVVHANCLEVRHFVWTMINRATGGDIWDHLHSVHGGGDVVPVEPGVDSRFEMMGEGGCEVEGLLADEAREFALLGARVSRLLLVRHEVPFAETTPVMARGGREMLLQALIRTIRLIAGRTREPSS